jgi:hypothetical protein
MRKKIVTNVLILVVVALGICACALRTKTTTLEEIKPGLNCLVYTGEIKWKAIEEKLGEPDYAPIPTGQKLSQNIRIYTDLTIMFHTELKSKKVDGKIRYEEVITELEICKER